MGIHRFDDGSDESLLERVARDYLELLTPLKENSEPPGPRGPYLKTLRQLPLDPTAELIADKTAVSNLGPLPGAYVVIGGGDSLASSAELIKWDQTVRVYLASGAVGRLVGGRLTDAAKKPGQDPGIFTMWQHAIEYLHGAVKSQSAIRVEDHAPVFASESYSIWVLVTRLKVQQLVNPSRDAPLIDRVDANHAHVGSGNIASQRREF